MAGRRISAKHPADAPIPWATAAPRVFDSRRWRDIPNVEFIVYEQFGVILTDAGWVKVQ